MNRNSLPYTIIFSFVITFLLVLPLTVANDLTKPIVEKNKALSGARGILEALDVPLASLDSDQILAMFQKLEVFTLDVDGKLKGLSHKDLEASEKTGTPVFPLYFRSIDAGEPRYAGKFVGPGLWGTLTIALGFNKDLSRFTGLKVLDQAETPGLGARIAESWFTSQFHGQAIPASAELVYKSGDGRGDTNMDDSAVDGVTGATITTNGIRNIVNKAVIDMKKLFGGEK